MRTRFIFIYVICISMTAFSWYYACAFCGVYQKTAKSWICDGFISLIIDILVDTFKILGHLLARFYAKKYPKSPEYKFTYLITLKIL